MQVLYLGRAPRTKETLPDFLKWRRVTRHPLVFRGLTGSQQTPGFGASQKVYRLDVKSTFLNGFLQEEIYVEQPKGFVKKGEEDKVYLLKKALYELKQASRS